VSCHSVPGRPPYAGGFAVKAPFGKIYSSNITPDPTFGIGKYSFDDFRTAMRAGVTPSGKHLYPAMPYASFAAASDDDLRDLYNYLREGVAAVAVKPPDTDLLFPFNQRWGMTFWNLFFARHARFAPDPKHDAPWNRGAYLVQSFGHCGACHTTRGIAYQERGYNEDSRYFLAGMVLDNWYAGDLREDNATGLARWSARDIDRLLKTGIAAGSAVFGSMTEVVEHSTQYLRDDDRLAIATYLKSLGPSSENARYVAGREEPLVAVAAAAPKGEHPGAGVYANFCSKCHAEDGKGEPGRYPALAGSPMLLSDNPLSVARLVLEGGPTARTSAGPKREMMPAFAHRLTDAQIADALNFARQSFGNQASPIPAKVVSDLRRALEE
jgi:mono/diheme cytochrome c family protein